MSKYYSISEFSKILGVSQQTLRNWDKNNKLKPHHTYGNGYRYYSHEQLNSILNYNHRYNENKLDNIFINTILNICNLYYEYVSSDTQEDIKKIQVMFSKTNSERGGL